MKIIDLKLSDIKPYEKNPRKNDEAVKYVMQSIKEFGFKVPIVIDKNNTIVAGHTRYKASKKLKLDKVPCVVADDLSDEQIKAFRLADNKVSEKSEWDFGLLDMELSEILDIDMELLGFEDIEESLNEGKYSGKGESLNEKFIVPPFSIFDSRQGYWQDRKKEWKSLGIQSELGRDDSLLGSGLKQLAQDYGSKNLTGTSVFDPVLCEIIYKWFNIDGGSIFDCFAGGSVRGIIASKLGYNYTGIDLRPEQIEANKQNAKELGLNVNWYCDDSLNADKYIEDNSVDLIFSCPPYGDLEQYSDDPRDISNMDYEDFIKVYNQIIKIALNKLKEDRFAVFVVGDIRDKKGFYRDFISHTKQAFIDCGVHLYNEIILIESGATAQLRASKVFSSGRKVVKMHQNVLVFYKGNPKKIKENYKEIDIENIIDKALEE